MPRGWKRTWVKFWVAECIDGSMREQLEADERGVWYDLIILSARCRVPGIIASNETEPMSHRRIAGILNISEELLERTLKKCQEQERISINETGLITILNWNKYQSEYQRQKQSTGKGIPPDDPEQREIEGWKQDPNGMWYKPVKKSDWKNPRQDSDLKKYIEDFSEEELDRMTDEETNELYRTYPHRPIDPNFQEKSNELVRQSINYRVNKE